MTKYYLSFSMFRASPMHEKKVQRLHDMYA